MKLVALVGSLRKDSLNLQLVETMQNRYKDTLSLELGDVRSLPYYDQDGEAGAPESVSRLQSQVEEADGVLIVTPEFNWSLPGVLKNALDWLSRGRRVMNNKPVLVAGVSPFMMGTLRAQQHLRDVLGSPGISAMMLPPGGNEILITFGNEKFKDRQLVDPSALAFLDSVVDKFLNMVQSAQAR